MKTHPIKDPQVAAAYASFPADIRQALLKLRNLILTVGNELEEIGKVSETLKWGQPSYSTLSGSPIRLGRIQKDPEKIALYFHCQTKLISTFRTLYPKTFTFDGNRAIVFHKTDLIPKKELTNCLELAHSYHRRKNKPLLGTTET